MTLPLCFKELLLLMLFASVSVAAAAQATSPYPIQHVIVIMQENRSFDNYFGTFPGANGVPAGTCIPLDPVNPAQGCITPFHDVHDSNSGGPHNDTDATADLDDGITTAKMDGFVREQATGGSMCGGPSSPAQVAQMPVKPQCVTGIHNGIARHDVMGYHTDAEIPNYWAYAENFVLQDSMFEGDRGWSADAHLEMTSQWTAHCTNTSDVSTCTTSMNPSLASATAAPKYPWVNLFQLMDTNNVSWKYYLGDGPDPDCDDGQMTCDPQNQQSDKVPSFWNPVPGFTWVSQQGSAYLAVHEPQVDQLLVDLRDGTLPQVSWVVPSFPVSEHPTYGVTAGMEYVTSLVNAVMESTYWQNTAIFVA